jgi:hypothetical protein
MSSLPLLDNYRYKFLFLNNDPGGDRFTSIGIQRDPTTWFDMRSLYKGYNDLNTWACDFGKATFPPPSAPNDKPPYITIADL